MLYWWKIRVRGQLSLDGPIFCLLAIFNSSTRNLILMFTYTHCTETPTFTTSIFSTEDDKHRPEEVMIETKFLNIILWDRLRR